MKLHPGVLLAGFAGVLIAALLGTLAQPGILAQRDMLVLDHPALSAGALGFGTLPARNAPQDGMLALAGLIVPATWLVRLLIVGAAGIGAYLLAAGTKERPLPQRMAAMAITLWNPFVVERLLQGQWSLAMAAWLLPGIAVCSTRWRLAAIWIASITPTGLLLATAVALVAGPRRKLTAAWAGFCALPWIVPSLLATPQGFGTDAFVARAEGAAGTVGALLGTGGIWNSAAVPASRETPLVFAGVLLFALLVPFAPKRLIALAAAGIGAALLLTFGPGEWLTSIPGLALFRDSHKLAALALPALAVGATQIHAGRFSSWVAALAAVLAIAQVPDAPLALKQIAPIELASDPATGVGYRALPGTLLNPDVRGLVAVGNRVTVDPWDKATSTVAAGALAVDGEQVDAPSPDYQHAVGCWEARDLPCLEEAGVRWVISGGRMHVLFDAHAFPLPAATVPMAAALTPAPRPEPTWWLGLLLSLCWLCAPLFLLRKTR